MKLLYLFKTKIGPFYIGEQGGRFHPAYDDEVSEATHMHGRQQRTSQGATPSRFRPVLTLRHWGFQRIYRSGNESNNHE